MISNKLIGRNVIHMFKDLFDIPKDLPIREMTINAPSDDVATATITTLLKAKDIDITTKELSKNTVAKEYKYEISVKRVEP